MSQIETKSIVRGLKGLMVAAAAGAALIAMATPASASAIFLDKGQMFNAPTVTLSEWGYGTESAKAGPVLFTANYGTSASANTFQFLGFCVDIFDTINPSNSLNLQYQTGTLTDNGSDSFWTYNSLDASEVTKINKLITYGTNLFNADAVGDPSHNISSTLANQLAAVQGAIWQIENPNLNIDGSNTVESLIGTYTSNSFLNGQTTGNMTVIFDQDGSPHQTFAFISPGGVPEPTSWALMIMGFGAVGAAMRQRRRTAVAFA